MIWFCHCDEVLKIFSFHYIIFFAYLFYCFLSLLKLLSIVWMDANYISYDETKQILNLKFML